MPWGPLYTDLPLITLPAGRSARVVDENAWTTLITNLGTWPADVNAGAHNLNNLARLNAVDLWLSYGIPVRLTGPGFKYIECESNHFAMYKKNGGNAFYWRRSDDGHVGGPNEVDLMYLIDSGQLLIYGPAGEGVRVYQTASGGFSLLGFRDSDSTGRFGAFHPTLGWRVTTFTGSDGEAARFMNGNENGYVSVGYVAASNTGRVGVFLPGTGWQTLVLNAGFAPVNICGKTYINNYAFATPETPSSIALAIGDPDTGLDSSSDGVLLVKTNGLARMTFYSNGYIGHTPPGNFADNAAAVAAGLGVGTIYRSGDFLKVVH